MGFSGDLFISTSTTVSCNINPVKLIDTTYNSYSYSVIHIFLFSYLLSYIFLYPVYTSDLVYYINDGAVFAFYVSVICISKLLYENFKRFGSIL